MTDDSSSGDDGAHQHSVEEEIDHNAEDARSLVLFDTMEMSETDFLMPVGLNLFSVVALPAKRDKLVAVATGVRAEGEIIVIAVAAEAR